MKRTPLSRGKMSLGRRRGALAYPDPGDQFAKDRWRTWAGMQPCAVCGSTERVEGHHVIPAQELKRRGLEHLLWDRRNCLPLDRRCHDNHEVASRRVTFDELRPENLAFADSLDLAWLIRWTYPREAAA